MALVANSAGVVTGKFKIPAGIPAGTKMVRFTGSGGSNGQATFTGQGTLNTVTLRQTRTLITERYDPLAQTFTLEQASQISAVDLYFAAKGTTPLVVQIRETSNGVPTQEVLAERRLAPADITSLTAHTHVVFPSPVALSGGVEYALVLMCDDAVSAVRVGELGKWDEYLKKWVTSQPYQVGVLLSSSNASSWTPHQDKDLTFLLHRADYSQTERTVNLGTVAVVDATDLLLLTADEVPSSETRIEYSLSLPDGSTIAVSDGQPVRLAAAITGNVTINAKLIGSAMFSPVLFPGTQLVAGQVGTSGDYVSRAIKGGSNVRVKVVYDALIPSGSSVAVTFRGADLGDAWASVPFASSSPLDDGWQEMVHEVTGVTEQMVQVRLALTGTTASRPRVRNLRFMTI